MPYTRPPVRARSSLADHPVVVAVVSGVASLALLGRHVIPFGGMVEPGGDYGLMAWNLWIVNRAITHGENVETSTVWAARSKRYRRIMPLPP